MKKKILIIHGPNINMVGEREIRIYGKESIEDINKDISAYASGLSLECDIYHSNHEGVIIDWLQQAPDKYAGIVINAGAFSHYSIAIRDAIAMLKIPCIEVHLSNIYAREEFRRTSILAPVCAGHIAGFGKHGYFLALHGLKEMI